MIIWPSSNYTTQINIWFDRIKKIDYVELQQEDGSWKKQQLINGSFFTKTEYGKRYDFRVKVR